MNAAPANVDTPRATQSAVALSKRDGQREKIKYAEKSSRGTKTAPINFQTMLFRLMFMRALTPNVQSSGTRDE